MLRTCIIKNFSPLLFATLMIGQNLLTHKKNPLKVEFKYISFHELPICRFIHSLCENENIPI